MNSLYFDHQATCPLDQRVFDEMSASMMGSVGNPHSAEHSFGWRAEKAVSEAKYKIANLVGCDSDEIFFTSGATEANNLALKGLDYSVRNSAIICPIDHKCVIEAARHIEKTRRVDLKWLGVDRVGQIDMDSLRKIVDENVAVISVIGVHNEIGTIQNLREISLICRPLGIKIHADMAQAPAAISLRDVIDYVDTFSLSAHKYYGPMGIGCLYIRRDIQSDYEPILHGGGQQSGLRSGTVPVSLAVGMGAASQLIQVGNDERASLRQRNKLLWEEILKLGFPVELNGPDLDHRHPGNLNVSFLGFEAEDIIAALQPKLAISSGSACTSGMPEPSYVLKATGLSSERVSSAIRLSIGRYTTVDDIQSGVALINDVLARLPRIAA